MSDLKVCLERMPFGAQLEQVNHLLANARATTTFWGSRLITIQGYTDSVSLEMVAKKVLDAAYERKRADNLTREERLIGIELVRKVKNFYVMTDQALQASSFFTRMLCWLREFSFFPYTTRFNIEETAEKQFCTYSQASYSRDFIPESNRLMKAAFTGNVVNLVVLEETIRSHRPAPVGDASQISLQVGDRFRFIERTDPRRGAHLSSTFSYSNEVVHVVDAIENGQVKVHIEENAGPQRQFSIPIPVLTAFAYRKLPAS